MTEKVIAAAVKALATILIICGFLFLPTAASNQKVVRKIEKGAIIKIIRLNVEVYLLSTSNAEIGVGNIGLSIGRDGILMIDTQLASLAPQIKAAIRKISARRIRLLINTHWHGDHTGGNEIFGKEAMIIAQQNVRPYLLDETSPPMPRPGLPQINYKDKLQLDFNNDKIDIIHFPNAHTDGDSVVYFTKANIIHLGDLYKGHRFPGVDLGHGGSVIGLAEAIEKIIAMLPGDIKIIPGHGDLATLSDLKIYHLMLLDTIAFVKGEKDKGKTLEAIKSQGFPKQFDSWSNGLTKSDLWIEQIWKSLNKKVS